MKRSTTAPAKKSKPTQSVAIKKATSVKFKTVDDYIASLPVDLIAKAKKLRKTIRQAIPKAEELISYNMPSYKLNGFVVSFAVWKDHIGLYPITSYVESAIKELTEYKGSKATLKFSFDKPIPFDLISKMAKLRAQENLEKAKK